MGRSKFNEKQCPIYKIDFIEVMDIAFSFNHFQDYLYKEEKNKHYTWRIDCSAIKQEKTNGQLKYLNMRRRQQ